MIRARRIAVLKALICIKGRQGESINMAMRDGAIRRVSKTHKP